MGLGKVQEEGKGGFTHPPFFLPPFCAKLEEGGQSPPFSYSIYSDTVLNGKKNPSFLYITAIRFSHHFFRANNTQIYDRRFRLIINSKTTLDEQNRFVSHIFPLSLSD